MSCQDKPQKICWSHTIKEHNKSNSENERKNRNGNGNNAKQKKLTVNFFTLKHKGISILRRVKGELFSLLFNFRIFF